jgi:hypothetical protein
MSVAINMNEEDIIKIEFEKLLYRKTGWWELIKNMFKEWTYEIYCPFSREEVIIHTHVDLTEEEMRGFETRFPNWRIVKKYHHMFGF